MTGAYAFHIGVSRSILLDAAAERIIASYVKTRAPYCMGETPMSTLQPLQFYFMHLMPYPDVAPVPTLILWETKDRIVPIEQSKVSTSLISTSEIGRERLHRKYR